MYVWVRIQGCWFIVGATCTGSTRCYSSFLGILLVLLVYIWGRSQAFSVGTRAWFAVVAFGFG